MYVSVIVDNPSSNVDYEFEYLVPSIYESVMAPGIRVKVNFGKSNKEILGYVHDVYLESKYEGNKKEIIEVLDFEPIISEASLKLADFIQYDTLSPRVRVLNQMVPKSLRLKTTKYLQVEDYNMLDANLAIMFKGKKLIPYTNELLNYKSIINKMIENKVLITTYGSKVASCEKTVTKYKLNIRKYNEEKKFITNPADLEALELLLNAEDYLQTDEITAEFGITNYKINKYIKMGLMNSKEVVISRIRNRNLNYHNANFSIDDDTLALVDKYCNKIADTNKNILWIPKTITEERAFIKKIVIDDCSKGLKTLIVVPDILSSYRYSTYITQDTDLNVATLNSKITPSEEYDYFHFIRKGNFDVIVTTPVAALWSYDNIGTIIMIDSENVGHRNDQSPRYDLNNVLEYLAELHHAKLIKHTLAPRLIDYSESMLNHMLLLNDGYHDDNNINIELIDMTKDVYHNNPVISLQLLNKIKETTKKGLSTLLILNNKSYSKSIVCRNCAHTLVCDDCKVSLSYYKEKNLLRCSHCGKKYEVIDVCPKCGLSALKHTGYGMENVKEIIEHEFPNVSAVVLDTASVDELNNHLEESNDGKVSIFITSDVYSRSLIDEHIGLVGIVNLDAVSKSSNFTAHDNAYQLLIHAKYHLTEGGTMIIQTSDITQPLLKSFIIGDYNLYFDSEIQIRQLLKVEPFYQVNRIIVKSSYEENFMIANKIRKAIWNLVKEEVIILGPSYNYQEKGVQLIIKHHSKKMNDIYHTIYKAYKDSKAIIVFDKYPKYL